MMIRGSGALVTGGSEGLGAALAKELAKRGARVVVVARGEAKLHEVVRAIRRDGGDAHAVVGTSETSSRRTPSQAPRPRSSAPWTS